MKGSDSRTANWDGLGQVELDAVEPRKLQRLCSDAIETVLDKYNLDRLMMTEKREQKVYESALKDFVDNL